MEKFSYRRLKKKKQPEPRKENKIGFDDLKSKIYPKKIPQKTLKKKKSESEVAQSCPTLCDPMDCSLPGFSVHGIFQARVWSGLPFPSPGDLPDPGIKPRSPALQADALPSEPPGKPSKF